MQIYPLAKIFNSKIIICCTFRAVPVQSSKNMSHPMYTFPTEVKQGNALPSCSCSHTVNKCPFTMYLMPHFYTFSTSFLGDFYCVKWLPCIMLKCWLMFLSAQKLWCNHKRCDYRENTYFCSFIQAWVIVLLSVSLILMN